MNKNKTKIFRELIIFAGFFPGLWLWVGVNPKTQVDLAMIDTVVNYFSTIVSNSNIDISRWAHFIYDIMGYGSEIFTWYFVFQFGGISGFLAIFVAFLGGYFIDSFGIWLLLGALIMAPFLPIDEEHSL